MSNASKTAKFFKLIDAATRTEILENISRHYGVTPKEALYEVTLEDSEHLLDYVKGSLRTATRILMMRHGMN